MQKQSKIFVQKLDNILNHAILIEQLEKDVHMQIKQNINPDEIKTEDDFNAVLDDILKDNGIEVDEDSE